MPRVGVTTGCFDCFHAGHAAFLRACRQYCEYLIVGVNTDESVQQLKGIWRPRQRIGERMDTVICFADLVFNFHGDDEELLQFRPHVLLRGWDQDANMSLFGSIPIYVQLPRNGEVSTTSILGGRS